MIRLLQLGVPLQGFCGELNRKTINQWCQDVYWYRISVNRMTHCQLIVIIDTPTYNGSLSERFAVPFRGSSFPAWSVSFKVGRCWSVAEAWLLATDARSCCHCCGCWCWWWWWRRRWRRRRWWLWLWLWLWLWWFDLQLWFWLWWWRRNKIENMQTKGRSTFELQYIVFPARSVQFDLEPCGRPCSLVTSTEWPLGKRVLHQMSWLNSGNGYGAWCPQTWKRTSENRYL